MQRDTDETMNSFSTTAVVKKIHTSLKQKGKKYFLKYSNL